MKNNYLLIAAAGVALGWYGIILVVFWLHWYVDCIVYMADREKNNQPTTRIMTMENKIEENETWDLSEIFGEARDMINEINEINEDDCWDLAAGDDDYQV